MEKFSIIIPTRNHLDLLIPLLRNLQQSVQLPYEVIVVSNGCSDGTVPVVRTMGHKVVELLENKGFAAACNLGAKTATSENLVFLNNDTLPGPYWLLKMYSCLRFFNKKFPEGAPVGAVGPCSNFSAGRQRINMPDVNPMDLAAVFQKLQPESWVATGFLSGFCLLTPKKIFDSVGGFDEDFFCGCEDDAYCLSLQLKGYSCVIAYDSYVFHHGSATMRSPEFEKFKLGTIDRPKFADKYRVKGPQKMAVLYRTKVEDEFFANIFDKSLEKSASFADGIFILDDGSPYDISPLIEKYKDKIVRYEKFHREHGEKRDRQQLYYWAREAGFDWVFSIDSDEIVEDKFTREYAQRLMHPYAPTLLNYWVHFYTFWDDFEHYRVDDVWGRMAGPRIARILPDQVGTGAASDLHIGNVPIRPLENTQVSSVRIKHYGYLRPDDRQRKYAWYTKQDPNPSVELVGHPDYKHLIQDNFYQLSIWHEENSIGLVTIMKDEEELLTHFLRLAQAFCDEFCLVDTGSKDNSIAIAEAAGIKVLHSNAEDNFSEWRNTALRVCKSTWGIHWDIDEEFEDLITVRRMTEDHSADGFVFYVKNFMPDGRYTVSETIRLMRNPREWYYTGYVHETTDDYLSSVKKNIKRSPLHVHHFGYFRSRVPEKFKKYVKVNRKQMHDFPNDARPVFNLAMHYLEEPEYYEEGKKLLERAVKLNDRFYSPRKELVIVKMREAMMDAQKLLTLLPQDHLFYSFAQEVIQTLSKWVQPLQRLAPGHVAEAIASEEAPKKEGGNGREAFKELGGGPRAFIPPQPENVSKKTGSLSGSLT